VLAREGREPRTMRLRILGLPLRRDAHLFVELRVDHDGIATYKTEQNPAAGAGLQAAPHLLHLPRIPGTTDRVARFKAKMERYFSTQYEKLERGVVEAADQVNARLDIAGVAGRAL
jgi:hypothetical protein